MTQFPLWSSECVRKEVKTYQGLAQRGHRGPHSAGWNGLNCRERLWLSSIQIASSVRERLCVRRIHVCMRVRADCCADFSICPWVPSGGVVLENPAFPQKGGNTTSWITPTSLAVKHCTLNTHSLLPCEQLLHSFFVHCTQVFSCMSFFILKRFWIFVYDLA